MKTLSKTSPVLFAMLALMVGQFACNFSAQPPATIPQVPGNTLPPTTASAPPSASALSGDPTAIVTPAIQTLPTLSYRKKEWFTDSQGNLPDIT